MHRFAGSVRLKPGSRYGPIIWWPSNKEISSVVSSWWQERVKELINEERAEDAKSLYLEFGDVSPKS